MYDRALYFSNYKTEYIIFNSIDNKWHIENKNEFSIYYYDKNNFNKYVRTEKLYYYPISSELESINNYLQCMENKTGEPTC